MTLILFPALAAGILVGGIAAAAVGVVVLSALADEDDPTLLGPAD